MTKWTSIAWRKRNDWIDFYQTPTWCVEKLLERETFFPHILEPAVWAGAIAKVLEDKWYIVVWMDIRDDESVYGIRWKDFFKKTIPFVWDIISNPPYFCAKEFIEKAIEIWDGKIAMLLKLSFLESADRYEFFQNTPLRTVYVFCKRVNMYPEWQPKPKNSWTIAYAWYVWEKWYEWKPNIEWIL